MSDHHTHELADDEVHIHALSVGLLLKVFLALVGLTILTVLTGKADLYGMDLAVALIIATCKATLVCLFFSLFLAFVALDKGQYEGDVLARQADERAAQEAAE